MLQGCTRILASDNDQQTPTSKNPVKRKLNFAEFPFRDCMKTPDRCRSGTPPSAENGLRGLYFGVWCYRRPTIGASPATFHTVSPRTPVNISRGRQVSLWQRLDAVAGSDRAAREYVGSQPAPVY